AHINLDLGLAAATICPGGEIESLQTDFLKINLILASLVEECIREFGKIWPIIGWADSMLDSQETILVDLAMEQARNYAWNVAQRFSPLPPSAWPGAIAELDKEVSSWAHEIYHPGFPVNFVLWLFHITDRKTVPETIQILTEKAARMQPRNVTPIS